MKKILSNKKAAVTITALGVFLIGALTTLGILVSTTKTVANTFEGAEVKTKIEEEFEGTIKKGETIKKNPSVKNEEKSDAFIRVRVTVTPEEILSSSEEVDETKIYLLCSDGKPLGTQTDVLYNKEGSIKGEDVVNEQYGWIYSDGYYYYNTPIKKSANTKSLFENVKIGSDIPCNFDVTISQDAVFADGYKAGDVVSVEKIKAEFDKIK